MPLIDPTNEATVLVRVVSIPNRTSEGVVILVYMGRDKCGFETGYYFCLVPVVTPLAVQRGTTLLFAFGPKV